MTAASRAEPETDAFLDALRRRKPLWRFLGRLARAAGDAGGTVYLVGGYVRDLALGRAGKDLDILVDGVDREALGALLRRLPARALGVRRIGPAGKAFPVYKARTDWEPRDIDIAAPRGGSAREDAARRDFTVNALLFRVDPVKRGLSGELVDHFGGLADLRRRRIRAVGDPDDRFAEDPLRILRAIRMRRERPGHAIDRATWRAIRSAAPGLARSVSADRIVAELLRALAADPAGTMADLGRAGLLPALLPEVAGWDAGPLRRSMRRFRALAGSLGRPLPEPVALASFLWEVARAECDAALRAAPARPGALAGELFRLPRTAAAARRLRIPGIREVLRTLADVARLREMARLPNPLAQAERILARDRSGKRTLALYRAVALSERRRPYDLRGLLRRAAARPPLLSGRRLLELGVPAGRAIETILDEVRQATLAGRVASRSGAERLALAIHAGDPPRRRPGGVTMKLEDP